MSNPRALQRIRFWSLVFSWISLLSFVFDSQLMIRALIDNNENLNDMFDISSGILSDTVLWTSALSRVGWIAIRLLAMFFLCQGLAHIIQSVLALLEELKKRSGATADIDIASLPELNG